jgi:polyisoprenoid-binding protein YceI
MSTSTALAGTFNADPVHSSFGFAVKYQNVSNFRGTLGEVAATFVDGKLEGTAQVESISIVTPEQFRAHVLSADFFDVENHPRITFSGHFAERTGATTFKGEVDLTIRGVTRNVPLDVVSLGEWKTPFWVGDENKGELRRIGFEAKTTINRHDFSVSWQDELPGGGVVVSNEIDLTLDVEAILLDDLEQTGAIEYYRS